jgi:hypothetical protein
MPHVELDPHTADRILAGVVHPDDSPPGWAPVVRLLDAAALGEQLVESTARCTVTNMAAVIQWLRSDEFGGRQGGTVRRGRRRGTLTVVCAAVILAIAAGSAVAATHPSSARRLAASVLARVGAGSSEPRQGSLASPLAPPTPAETHRAAHPHPGARNAHGKAVSAVAHTSGLKGRAHGEAVSTVASRGKSHAGHPPGQAKAKQSRTPHPPQGVARHGGVRGKSSAHAHSANRASSAKKAQKGR